jgi:DNA-binding transcriptional ArsR family regulator
MRWCRTARRTPLEPQRGAIDFHLTNALNEVVDPLSITFAALADPTRRAILTRLAEGDAHVGDLAQPFDISAPAISRHLRVLENAGLISREVNAQWRLCRLRTPPLQQAHGWLEHYAEHWERSLARLTELVESRQQHSPRKPARRRKPR